MLKFKRTVVAGEFLNPEEAFEANRLIKLIKATLDCGVDHLFDEGWIDCKVVYANGLNGTDWDCRENYHLPLFKVFREDEDLARMTLTVRVNRATGEIILDLDYRKNVSSKFERISTYYNCSCKNSWDNLMRAFSSAFDDLEGYDAVWAVNVTSGEDEQ